MTQPKKKAPAYEAPSLGWWVEGCRAQWKAEDTRAKEASKKKREKSPRER